jgi:hypothetical protein
MEGFVETSEARQKETQRAPLVSVDTPVPALPTAAVRVRTWPHLVRKEVIASQVVVLAVLVLGIVFSAPLGPPADAVNAPLELKAPWYFVALQELLVYLEPWVVGGLLPVLALLALAFWPYVDPARDSPGLGRGERRLVRGALGLTVFAWGTLTLIGAELRGPAWTFLWPWQRWDARMAVSAPQGSLAAVMGLAGHDNLVGGIAIALWSAATVLAWLWIRRRWARAGAMRVGLVVLVTSSFVGLAVKVLLSGLLGVGCLCRVGGFGI